MMRYCSVSGCKKALLICVCLIGPPGCGQGQDDQEIAARHVRVADVYRSQGRLRASALECQRALRLDRENTEALMCLARLALEAGDGRSAEQALQSAGTAGAPSDARKLMLAEAYLLQGRFTLALDHLDALANGELASNPRYLLIRGEAELGNGAHDMAKALFSAVGTLGAEGAKALVWLAKAALMEGDPESAKEYLEQAEQAEARTPELWLLRGHLAMAEKNYVGAVERFHRARQSDRADLVTPAKIEATRGLILANLAQEKFDEADRIRDEFLSTYPGSLLSVFERGLEAVRAADFDVAEKSLREVIAREPEHLPSVRLLGAINYFQGDLEEASQLLAAGAGAEDSPAAHKLLALTQLRLRQPHLAQQRLERAVEQHPEDGDLHALLARAYYAQGNRSGARRELGEALRSSPRDASVRTAVAELYLSLGEPGQAVSQLKQALDLDAGFHRARALLVIAYQAAGQPAMARSLADEWVEAQPTEPIAQYAAGMVALSGARTKEARQHFENAVRLHPRYESAWMMLARLDLDAGMADWALERYEAVLAFNPRSVEAMRGYLLASTASGDAERGPAMLQALLAENRAASSARMILAEHYLRQRQPEKALGLGRELLRADPSLMDAHLVIGRAEAMAGNPAAALTSFRAYASGLPGSPAGHLAIAETEAFLGNLTAARESVAEALELQPDYVPALSLMASLEIEAGNEVQAAARIRAIRAAEPDSATADERQGDLDMVRKRYPEALAAYRSAFGKAPSTALVLKVAGAMQVAGQGPSRVRWLTEWLEGHPADHETRGALAAALAADGANDAAIREYEELREAQPGDAVAANNLAWLYFEKGDSRALALAEEAHRLSPENGDICDTLGWILVQTGDPSRGIELLKKASRLLPESQEVKRHLAMALRGTGADAVNGR